MAFQVVKNVAIRGIAACVPKTVEENRNLPFYAPGEAEQVIAATGIERRHIATIDQTASDLGYEAARKLIEALGWENESIDLLAFCTQNPDYQNHPNSFIVHDRLGLAENAMCLDLYHGCPGWVVSMSAVMSMMQNGNIKRAILLDGDTVSKDQDASNREERPLFGDACTATALEYDVAAKDVMFNLGTLSADGMALAHLDGGYRHPFTMQTLERELRRKSGTLNPEDSVSAMDSMDVFSFAITKVPKAIKRLLSEFELNMEQVDNIILHQANKLILENIAKRLKVNMDKVPIGLRNYGNTTSASIPLAFVSERAHELKGKQKNLVCGFGTGLAWGAAYFETENVICPPIVEI